MTRYIATAILLLTNPVELLARAQQGVASWYGEEYRGRDTASGLKFDPDKVSVAHRTLPLFTTLEITNPKTRRRIYALVTDRGPYIEGRELDLSAEAFRRLAPLDVGLITVEYRIIH